MNISLIGMMGSGKTTISKLLSEKLADFVLVDTDELIALKEGKSINDIFSQNGEAYFRKVETEILKSVLSDNNQIISTGGGIVKSVENLKLLKENSKLFYLYADVESLYSRVKNNNERPLLNCDDMYEKINLIFSQRKSLYEKADFIINTVDNEPEMIVEEIIEKLR